MSFYARYFGTCAEPNCGQKIVPGEAVTYVDDELVHEECPEKLPERPERPPCPDCFLVHAGECF